MGPAVFRRIWPVTALAVTLLALSQPTVEAQARLQLSACKKVIPRAAVFGSELVIRDCGNRFTTQDSYIGIVVHLDSVRDQTQVAILLFDPEQNSVLASRIDVRPEPGYYGEYWLWGVLAVAADPAALAREDPQLVTHMISVRGKPIRERLGEWTLRVSLDRSAPVTLKFTLEAAPGAGPTPAPTPVPSPSP